jgi:DNA-binding protein H-NS
VRATLLRRRACCWAAGPQWSGRGPRPLWLHEALGAGRTLEEFKLGAQPPDAPAATEPAPALLAETKSTSEAKRAPAKILCKDDAGNAWSGRGPKPKWLKAALDAGKSLEDFAARSRKGTKRPLQRQSVEERADTRLATAPFEQSGAQ